MKIVTFDCETTTSHKGNPFDTSNKLCVVGVLDWKKNYYDVKIEYDSAPYWDNLERVRHNIESADLLVGFNLKFDLNWIRNYVDDLVIPDLWDCQLAAYILSGQTQTMPSLNACCEAAGLGSKLDVVKTEYWDRGIDTTDIPWDVLTEYLRQDVLLTRRLYEYQRDRLAEQPGLLRLFQLGCADLTFLLEAERNGLIYNVELSNKFAEEIKAKIESIDKRLKELWPYDFINWGSPSHISILLFGGEIYTTGRERYERTLKSGEVKIHERNCWVANTFPRLLSPDVRSETKDTANISIEEFEATNRKRIEERQKPLTRTYSVEEGILKMYKATGKAKETIMLMLERSELNKLISTYYEGLPQLMNEMGWTDSTLHGSFIQVSTRTGRLSSKGPNLQNFAGLIKPLFYTRFPSSVKE